MSKIPYGKQTITQADIDSVVEVLKSDWLTQGPTIAKFEKAFAQYTGCDYALAVSNGTAALHLAYLALGVCHGQTVLTTPNTFAATSNAVLMCGGDVVFADIDPDTQNIDLDQVEEILKRDKIKKNITGLSIVDFAGRPNDLLRARKMANQYGLWLLEDACHALGATYTDSEGQKCRVGDGKISDVTVFSFHPVKHLATGEGGMITTNNETLLKKMALLRTHGVTKENLQNTGYPDWYYEVQELGFNYRITDIQCALGLSQLTRMEENLKNRFEIANRYIKELDSLKTQLTCPSLPQDAGHAFHLFTIQTTRRNELYSHLKGQDIFCQLHYIPVYRHPLYQRRYNLNPAEFPVSELYFEKTLSLPMFHSLSHFDQQRVIQEIHNFYEK